MNFYYVDEKYEIENTEQKFERAKINDKMLKIKRKKKYKKMQTQQINIKQLHKTEVEKRK